MTDAKFIFCFENCKLMVETQKVIVLLHLNKGLILIYIIYQRQREQRLIFKLHNASKVEL